jgi:hypothetical protein
VAIFEEIDAFQGAASSIYLTLTLLLSLARKRMKAPAGGVVELSEREVAHVPAGNTKTEFEAASSPDQADAISITKISPEGDVRQHWQIVTTTPPGWRPRSSCPCLAGGTSKPNFLCSGTTIIGISRPRRDPRKSLHLLDNHRRAARGRDNPRRE